MLPMHDPLAASGNPGARSAIGPAAAGSTPPPMTIRVPTRVGLRIEAQNAAESMMQEVWTR